MQSVRQFRGRWCFLQVRRNEICQFGAESVEGITMGSHKGHGDDLVYIKGDEYDIQPLALKGTIMESQKGMRTIGRTSSEAYGILPQTIDISQ